MKHPETVASIRNRLFLLLLRAFTLVVSILLVFVLAVTAFFAYFPSRFNPLDRILMSVPDEAARARLVARPIPPAEVGSGWLGYAHDIVLRGAAATPELP